jgi:hypothetical protein
LFILQIDEEEWSADPEPIRLIKAAT